MAGMTKPQVLKKFFNTEGYPPLDNKEIMDLAKNHREDYNELADLAAKELGVEIEPPKM